MTFLTHKLCAESMGEQGPAYRTLIQMTILQYQGTLPKKHVFSLANDKTILNVVVYLQTLGIFFTFLEDYLT
jgi:hypothetical protein